MYEVTLTPDEMTLFINVVRKFREDFDGYPGSQMLLTDKPSFTAAANLFLAHVEQVASTDLFELTVSVRPMQRSEIEISRTPDGQFAIRAGGSFGILASTAVPYEISLVSDQNTKELLRSINTKFANQKDVIAAELESQADALR